MSEPTQNRYPGVNAHLNSYLQVVDGTWRSFHSEHIIDLARTIQPNLPDGYLAVPELSIQVTVLDADDPLALRSQRTIPDVMIYRQSELSDAEDASRQDALVDVLTLDLPEAVESLDEEDSLSGIILYQAGEGSGLGRPVTRVELLSPANKPGGSGHKTYEAKKLEALHSGLRLVEIDFLHHTPPVIPVLPRYNRNQKGAYPYTITIHDPRPTFEQGKAYVYRVGVDTPLPNLGIPLAGRDRVMVDFGAAYNATYQFSPFVGMAVDYWQDPLAFDKFTPEDQAKIRAILTQIRGE